jgi:hypothetical protein
MREILFLACKISASTLIISFVLMCGCIALSMISKQKSMRFWILATKTFEYLVFLSIGFFFIFFIMFCLVLMWS